ncbi:MAG: light-harvesting protein [Rhodobacterales bacterium]|nr:light-harvesting protein [Rhodobacterales bacterium]
MNNAKLWLVVKPTVGVPLFLTAVAVGSFAVHVAVLTNTSWVKDFLSGKPLGAGMASAVIEDATTAKVAYMAPGGKDIMVRMPDGSMAHAVLAEDVASLN